MDDAELADLLTSFFDAAFRQHANDARQAYALGLHLSYEDEDARKPIVSAGFNTEAGIEAALRRRSGFRRRGPAPADTDDARWDFAFWSHNDLARFGDPSRDPDGAEALNRWIRDRRLWYDADPRDVSDERFDRLLDLDEAIDDGLIDVLATVAERLQRDTVRWVVARPVPVLIHASTAPPNWPRRAAGRTRPGSRTSTPPGSRDRSRLRRRWLQRRPRHASSPHPKPRKCDGSSSPCASRSSRSRSCRRGGPSAMTGTNAKPIDEGAYLYLAATPFLAAVAMDQLRGTKGAVTPMSADGSHA